MTDKCGICVKSFSGKLQMKIKCAECDREFHPGCCRMSKADVDCLSVEGLVWRCQPCATDRRRSMRMDSQVLTGDLSLEDVMKELKEIKDEQKKSMSDFNISYECLSVKLNENTEMLCKQSDDIKHYREEIERVKEENLVLKKKCGDLEARITDCEQYSRRNCIEIQGIPAEANENVVDVVKKVGAALDIIIQDGMIDACHRLGQKPGARGPPAIIAKFVRRLDVEEILMKRRVKRNLSTRHMGLSSDCPVFINESLCPAKRVVYARARALKREKGYKYLWLRGGKIFLRKEEKCPVMVISCLADIDKL